jgi:hypothetical protein
MGLKTSVKVRIDRAALLSRANLAAIITADRGPSRRGRWLCPYHDDHDPSLSLSRDGRRFRCWSCGAKGNALDWYMRRDGLTFMEAAARIDPLIRVGSHKAPGRPEARPVASPRPTVPTPTRPAAAKPETAGSMLSRDRAAALVDEAASRLWSPEGVEALAYLRGRGLTDETIRAARLGWTGPMDELIGRPRGVVIPWSEGGRLVLVKLRQPEGARPKYRECYRDPGRPPRLYPGPEVVQPGRLLLIAEGEFDCLLLGQELSDLAAAVTLGSSSAGPTPDALAPLMGAPSWLVTHDADEAGDRAAALWTGEFARARRVRPPEGANDWTDLHTQARNAIRYHLVPLLGWRPPAWDELAGQTWGDAEEGDESSNKLNPDY